MGGGGGRRRRRLRTLAETHVAHAHKLPLCRRLRIDTQRHPMRGVLGTEDEPAATAVVAPGVEEVKGTATARGRAVRRLRVRHPVLTRWECANQTLLRGRVEHVCVCLSLLWGPSGDQEAIKWRSSGDQVQVAATPHAIRGSAIPRRGGSEASRQGPQGSLVTVVMCTVMSYRKVSNKFKLTGCKVKVSNLYTI